MVSGGAVFTEKMVSRRMARLGIFGGALAAVLAVGGGLAAASGGHDVAVGLLGGTGAGLVVGGYIATLSLMLLVQRVSVTASELKVQLGLWGPTISLAAIRSVSLVPVPRVRGRDVGIISPESTHCVRIEHEVDGKPEVFLLGTKEPDALMRALGGAAASRVRVEVEAESEVADIEATDMENERADERKLRR